MPASERSWLRPCRTHRRCCTIVNSIMGKLTRKRRERRTPVPVLVRGDDILLKLRMAFKRFQITLVTPVETLVQADCPPSSVFTSAIGVSGSANAFTLVESIAVTSLRSARSIKWRAKIIAYTRVPRDNADPADFVKLGRVEVRRTGVIASSDAAC